MNALDLKESLNEKINSVYYVYGNDFYLLSQAIKTFYNLIPKDLLDINLTKLNGNISFDELKKHYSSYAFMCDRKIIHWNIDKDQDMAFYKKVLTEANNNDNILLIVNNENKPSKAEKIFESINCNQLKPNQIFPIINKLLVENDYKMDYKAISELVSRCECDLGYIINSLEKLYLSTDNNIITKEIVEECVAEESGFSIYKITNEIADNQFSIAVKTVNTLLDRGINVEEILALITSHFRRMLYCKISTLPDEELAKNINVKLYAIVKLKEASRAFKPMEIKEIMDFLIGVMIDLRFSRINDNAIIYNVLAKLLKIKHSV